MRRRDRLEGHLWLKSYSGLDVKEVMAAAEGKQMSIATCMELLTRDFRMIVVAEQDVDRFCVRCYPDRGARARGLPYWAASYSGLFVGKTLKVAAHEYFMLHMCGDGIELASSEVGRWVS
jgi:hypothetical protein